MESYTQELLFNPHSFQRVLSVDCYKNALMLVVDNTRHNDSMQLVRLSTFLPFYFIKFNDSRDGHANLFFQRCSHTLFIQVQSTLSFNNVDDDRLESHCIFISKRCLRCFKIVLLYRIKVLWNAVFSKKGSLFRNTYHASSTFLIAKTIPTLEVCRSIHILCMLQPTFTNL